MSCDHGPGASVERSGLLWLNSSRVCFSPVGSSRGPEGISLAMKAVGLGGVIGVAGEAEANQRRLCVDAAEIRLVSSVVMDFIDQ